MSSHDSTLSHARGPITWIAGILVALLAVGGLAAPASAVAPGAITVSLAPTGETYDGTPVVAANTDYTLAVSYDATKLVAGEAIVIEVPAGVTIPDSSLVLPSTVTVFESVERQSDGSLKVIVKDPLPPGVNQGVWQLKFRMNESTVSEKRELTWRVDGTPTSHSVIFKKDGDQFENVQNSRGKRVDWANLQQYVSVSGGKVSVANAALGVDLPYTVSVDTTSSRAPFTITDAIDPRLAVTPSSAVATLTTWDADGLNRTATSSTPALTPTATGFTTSVDLPANSQYRLTYKARIANAQALAAIVAELQVAYDRVAATGGNFQAQLKNSVSWGDGAAASTSTFTFGGNAPAPAQPGYDQAFGKSVDPRSAPGSLDGKNLVDPLAVTYTLTADLTKWDGFADGPYALTRNVVIRDVLPAQADWNIGDTLTVTDQSGVATTFTPAAGLGAGAEAAIAADSYVGTYHLDGQTLLINVGRDITKKYTVTAKATITDVANLWADEKPTTTTYRVENKGVFIFRDGATVDKTTTTSIVVPKDTSGGVVDEGVFKKDAPAQVQLAVAPASISIPYTFSIGQRKADVTRSQIIDAVDTNVFDISDLAEIEKTIEVKYGDFPTNVVGWNDGVALTDAHWDLSLNADKELVFVFTDAFAAALKSKNVPADWKLSVKISLPVIPVPARQSLQIDNNARLEGAKDEITYRSARSSQASNYGDELEVRKTVFDAKKRAYTQNLRVVPGPDGTVIDDELYYRIQAVPHGAYGSLGVVIKDIVDRLPAEVTFLGFATESDVTAGTMRPGTSMDLPGNLRAVKTTEGGRDVVTVVQKPGTTLNTTVPVNTYIKVAMKNVVPGVGVANSIGDARATFTVTDEYPLSIAKLDATDATVPITDRKARFQLKNAAGTVIVDDIYVVDNQLVVAGANGADKAVAVDRVGTYTIVEVTAPEGYLVSEGTTAVTIDADGNSPQVKLYNEREPERSYAVGDYTWIDSDRDGIQDAGEPVLEGVRVALLDADGAVVAETTTDADGRYLFDGLPAGDYRVQFTLTDAQAQAYVFTTAGSGSASDSDGVVGDNAGVATTKVFTLDETNTALTTDYDRELIATRGVDPTWDAGVVLKKVSVGDLVWVDTDRDGVQDAGEPGIPGVKLVLTGPDGESVRDVFGDIVEPVVTDEDGSYSFDDLPAGVVYTVTIDREDADTITALKPYVPTEAGVGDDRGADSSTWTADSAALPNDGDRDATLDFGFVGKTYAIGDYTWIDANRDGIQSAGEEILAGVRVELLDAKGEVVGDTTTDASGRYLFDSLIEGTYQVRFTLTDAQAAIYEFTKNVAGADSTDNSDGIVGANLAVATTGKIVVGAARADAFSTEYPAQPFTASEGVDPTWDAGVVLKKVSVGDFVWVDTDRDGLQDSGEPGIAGVKLVLTGPNGEPVRDVFGDIVEPVVTDENGFYSFDDLPAGVVYTVTIDREDPETIEALKPYVPTEAGVGEDRGADSSTWTADSAALPNDGDRDPTLDFGFVGKTYAIGDIVWIDVDRDGIQDLSDGELPLSEVTVTLLYADGSPVEGVEPQVTTKDGRYLFDALPAGEYRVQFTLTDEQKKVYDFTSRGDGSATDSDAGVDGRTGVITLGPDNTALTHDYDRELTASEGVDPTWDAGVIRKKVSVGDLVWVDTDRDGLQDAGEPGIAGVKLVLTGPDGEPVRDVFGDIVEPVVTDENGFYSFDDLPAGVVYTVTIDREDADTIEALKPYVPTEAGVGEDRGTDSSTWTADSAALPNDGDRDPTLDFGFVTKTYAIGDVVWIDANKNGLQDDTEQVLPGVTVELLDADGAVLAVTKSDTNGRYLFDELGTGTYAVRFTLTAEQSAVYAFTKVQQGDRDGVDSDAVSTSPAVGTTRAIVLGDDNAALTTDYPFGSVRATQGIDPTWDAGVIVRDLPGDGSGSGDGDPAEPGTPTVGELPATGGTFAGGWVIAGLLLVATGILMLVRRRRTA